jgi:ribose transport system substrate-binding protein
MHRRSFLFRAAGSALLLSGCHRTASAKYRLAVIPKGLTHEHWQSVKRGADRAAADLGANGTTVDVVWDGPQTEGDSDQQINLIDQKVLTGIHGLILAPQNRNQMVPAVKRVIDRKLPVVIIDSDLDLQDDLLIKYVATDNRAGGRLAAEKLLDLVADKPRPRIALLRYQQGSESTEQREDGFLEVLRGKSIPVIDEPRRYAGATATTAQAEASTLLGANPADKGQGLDAVFAVNESATQGLVNAYREDRKRFGPIQIVGFDSSGPLLNALRDGDVAGLVVQDPYRMGYVALWTMVQYLEGYDVRSSGRYYGTGEDYLTKDNFETPECKGRYDPEAQAARPISSFHLPEYKKI